MLISAGLFSLLEILLGDVYIKENSKLCFPNPQSINWKDIMADQDLNGKLQNLQSSAAKCEHNLYPLYDITLYGFALLFIYLFLQVQLVLNHAKSGAAGAPL